MNKTAIRNFAIWARVQLIESAKQRAYAYEITEEGPNDPNAEIIGGKPISREEWNQRRQLIEEIGRKGYKQVMEEAAYTWFNRFIALRFMEVNGYLPTKVRVFTDESGAFKPEILREAMTVDLPVDREQVLQLLDRSDNEGLFKLLIIAQCNALNEGLPVMFEAISNWTELLFPAKLLKEDGVIGQMVSMIPEEDWKDAVQIVGWLYQYYNSELKDETFALLKKNVKITKERIPSATQLFTPDWIVRYMVENSLGRLWVEGHPNEALKANWKYYLEEAEQEPQVAAQLAEIRKGYASIKPEEIKLIDPCMGSGHILVYAFDVLMQIYLSCGYTERDAAQSILEHNLYGLDIDSRAAQLAYFAVMMKARQYDRRILARGIRPHVYEIVESGEVNSDMWSRFGPDKALAQELNRSFVNAKEYGSILHVNLTLQQLDTLQHRLDQIKEMSVYGNLPNQAADAKIIDAFTPLLELARVLILKYDVTVTNPPYMGSSGMNEKLSDYVKAQFPDSKSDLFAVFIERCGEMLNKNGYQAMITQHAWMFIASYENLREKLLQMRITNLVHLGIKAFEEIGNDIVQTCTFVMGKECISKYKSTFVRLVDCKNFKQKEDEFLLGSFNSVSNCDRFNRIPGKPLAYWVSDGFIDNFSKAKRIDEYGHFTGSQNITGDNERFLRYWWELYCSGINNRWMFYAKGGDYRQYYGNLDLVVDWSIKARAFYRDNKTSNLLAQSYWFKEGITYSAITSRGTGFRYLPTGCIFDKGGPSINVNTDLYEILGLLNSNVAKYYFWVFNPSINLQVKDIKNFPIILSGSNVVARRAKESTDICRDDWDSFETSWDFQRHPLVCPVSTVAEAYAAWVSECEERFNQLKDNEEEMNRIFIDIYGLRDELSAAVEERDVTVRRAELGRDIRSLISYAVGCMLGRYSIDVPGLAFAGGRWDEYLASEKYRQAAKTFAPDADGVLPITDDEYFTDDIVTRFVDFIRTVYGEETLEANLKFIAEALGGKGTPRQVIRSYFLNDFYADHLKVYQKRPIYWLFDSGKKDGFKCLIYMHRYQPDTIARIRTDYIHELQSRYRTTIADLSGRVESAAGSDRVKLTKQLTHIKDQELELQKYEEKIHHLADQMIGIDLDDGVKVNYAKFEDVLAKIK